MYYGKAANTLQSDVVVSDSEITGTLHYVTDFTEFSEEPEKQSGNYLALTFEANEDAKVTVTFNGGLTTFSPVVLEPGDRDCVFRITDKSSQSISVKVEKSGKTIDKTYSLTGLTLESEE